VHNCNSTKALRELRELIRARYELDIELWRNRDDLEADRPLWKKKMVQSDAILIEVQARVQKWVHVNEESGWEPEDWTRAEEIKKRLLPPGKRDWVKYPPWEKRERKGRQFRGKGKVRAVSSRSRNRLDETEEGADRTN
jgi:hypothetical protein